MGMNNNVSNTMQSQPIAEANITVVGNKTENGNQCCLISTIFLGGCLIFPLFFMCCSWWKKIVSCKYDLNIEFYRLLGDFLRR